ncbi:Sodium- and chloride-dependent glycine transporter 2 [Trichoplax sp. H2]|nr:Sodium- and chloride-dependent glycine transporter 2 [Trichoplax sp. H2]|eukprot:RDD36654.1 Sodium- and chloride-dependent glycine transporter 2 [Trichoplax sp. H2]
MSEKKPYEEGGEEEPERGHWGHKMDFLLSCIGYAVGLGNVWRFPYLCAASGGGAFLIPYCIMLILVGIPIFFMELTIGQYSQEGPLKVWENIFPLLKGVGYAMLVCSFGVGIYYNIIIAWCYYFLFASMQSKLPWASCGNPWNTALCRTSVTRCPTANVTNTTGVVTTVAPTTMANNMTNLTACIPKGFKVTSPSEEYWNKQVLDISKGIGEAGHIRWHLALCLLLAWIVIYFCIFKGIKSSGKVVYFSATFPYVVLVILLIRGVTLKGHLEGINFYLTPRWEKLSDANVWASATTQIFFSLSVGFGGLITMASYNKFYNNCFRDSLTVSLINCGTSFFAGFVIFSVVGFMANSSGRQVSEVADQGVSLAFIVYPAAVAEMPVSQLWSIIFFFMLITLGMDSQFAFMETIITAAVDEYPKVLRAKKWLISMIGCITLYFLGLPCITQAGAYVLQLMDDHVAGISLLILCIFEVIGCGWGYGAFQLMKDVEKMIGYKPFLYYWWIACWKFLSLATLLFVTIFKIVGYTKSSFGGKPMPDWADGVGWFMACCSMVFIPGVALYKMFTTDGSWSERFRILTTPRDDKYGDLQISAVEHELRKENGHNMEQTV